jgi:hypothetical protein
MKSYQNILHNISICQEIWYDYEHIVLEKVRMVYSKTTTKNERTHSFLLEIHTICKHCYSFFRMQVCSFLFTEH